MLVKHIAACSDYAQATVGMYTAITCICSQVNLFLAAEECMSQAVAGMLPRSGLRIMSSALCLEVWTAP